MNCQPAGAQLRAGTGKNNITAANCGDVHDSLFVKALVLENAFSRIAIITMDVIAIGGIGDIPDSFLPAVSTRLKTELRIDHVLVSASHNHLDGFLNGGKKITADVEGKTISAVKKAMANLEPVKIGAGTGFENRFAMNRRIRLKDGKVFTIRHANPNMPDDQIAGLGEIDPEIGILKLQRRDGTIKAVVFNYACHPYTGVPDKGVTAEYPGFASHLIEDQLGYQAMALFIQGAAGDITEILYKDTNHPRNCEPFGQMLGLSTLKALKEIAVGKSDQLSVVSESIKLPLRTDIPVLLDTLLQEEKRLLASLRSTSLNLKTFIPLYIKYNLSPDFPSYYAEQYLLEKKAGFSGLDKMDEANKKDIDKYLQNVLAMEKLTQIQEDRHQLLLRRDEIERLGGDQVSAQIIVLRIGDFILASFPGEAFSEVGLKIKENSPYPNTFVAGYSNGYLHYAPTEKSYRQEGYEVMNCILAPQWQKIYQEKIMELIKQL
ncbi:MAG: hypothetical protein A2W90_03665 [Bacteroidetes bacterium GWF2_42_66]|nr:MAG: hypothetical protein A2W92_18585 [Bacteroidetes bacterium GWA2_42_15]OFY02644.1 MAG: hypothetical protein A2W89_22185 [Bacteroidetes bacterium GWE2_42_39]OFY41465.1 MAG: hypothetical protein A2W90_03665 [Bacteroidetes bacterium GWF2_42_66]